MSVAALCFHPSGCSVAKRISSSGRARRILDPLGSFLAVTGIAILALALYHRLSVVSCCYFETVYELGPGLAYQLLLIILLTFLSMLLFSNLIGLVVDLFFSPAISISSIPLPVPAGLLLSTRA